LHPKKQKIRVSLSRSRKESNDKTDDLLPFVSPPPSQAPKTIAPKPKHTKEEHTKEEHTKEEHTKAKHRRLTWGAIDCFICILWNIFNESQTGADKRLEPSLVVMEIRGCLSVVSKKF